MINGSRLISIFLGSLHCFLIACSLSTSNEKESSSAELSKKHDSVQLDTVVSKDSAKQAPFVQEIDLLSKEPKPTQSRIKDQVPKKSTLHKQEVKAFNIDDSIQYENKYPKGEFYNAIDLDSTYVELYQQTIISFFKGWHSELTRFPEKQHTITLNKLIEIYERSISQLFFMSPRFIEYCMYTFTHSPELKDFTTKWNLKKE